MPRYSAPTRDTRFIINEMLDLGSYGDLPGFEMASPDVTDAVINEGGKFCAEVLAPLNQSGDQEGCTRHEDGSVTTPKGFKEAFDQFREAGWGTLSQPEEFGGQGMPHVLGFAFEEFVSSANQAFGMYPGLTNGAVSALLAKGSQEQKEKYLPKMISNEWTGTMNLTEPHCGTDLGMIRTKAEPQADGSFAITGTKIFISAGEHDMADNIIHLVLAKTPGAPDSTKGISLFVVPKFIVDEDGTPGERNGVACGSIEHKMGIHGNATCVMNYDDATGFLVGEAHKGMRAMFTMMNEARLGVGLQGYAQAESAYQNAVAYANDRLPRARGAAARELAEAAAYKEQIVAKAEGDASRFTSLYAEYRKAPQVTRQRLYLDTMSEVYGNSSKVVVDVDKGSPMIYLPLDQLLKNAPKPPAASAVDDVPTANPPSGNTYGDSSRSRSR